VAGVRDSASGDALRPQHLDVTQLGDFQPPDGLRLLVNHAGYRGPYLPIEETPPEEWRLTLETNVFAPIELIRRSLPLLRAAGGGVICNIGAFAVEMPTPFFSTYRASKAALLAVAQSIRVELAPLGIRVMDIPIAGVETDMMRTSITWRAPDAVRFEQYRAMAERVSDLSAVGRTSSVQPPEAARNVVEAILADEGPLRPTCDPNAVMLFERFAGVSEDARYESVLSAVGYGD